MFAQSWFLGHSDGLDPRRLRGQPARRHPEGSPSPAVSFRPRSVRISHRSRCRLALRDPAEAAQAYLNFRPYKEHLGVVYVHLRSNEDVLASAGEISEDEDLDYVDLKVGETSNLDLRRTNYALDCVDEPILWAFSYKTSYPKLVGK